MPACAARGRQGISTYSRKMPKDGIVTMGGTSVRSHDAVRNQSERSCISH